MTWIAACNGGRGIHQETIMTDEERRETVADIRQASLDVDMVKSMLETAADEIERLAKELFEARIRIERLEKEGWRVEND